MVEFIYINYVLLIGSGIVSLLFVGGLIVTLFNFFYHLILAIGSDIKYILRVFIGSVKKIVVPLFRIGGIITRAPIFLVLIILNSLRYLLSGAMRTLFKYGRTHFYIAKEDTIGDVANTHYYFDSKTMRARFNNLFRKYLARLYPAKYTRSRYGHTLTFLGGYLLRWVSYLFYLTFYYLIFLLRRSLYYIGIKPYVIDMFLFCFYYMYRTMSGWINVGFYKFCGNLYVFVRRQLYYFMPNWIIADFIQDLNLNGFEGNFEGNMVDSDDDTPEDIFMNNPNKKIVDFFYNVLPVTNLHYIAKINYPYFFVHYSLILKYIIILPLYLFIIVFTSILLLFIDILCMQLVLTHKMGWNVYKYFLRQQYNLYVYFINISSYSGYKLLIIPFKQFFIGFLKFIGWVFNFLTPLILNKCISCIIAVCFYIIYSLVGIIYYSPALLITLLINLGRLILRYRVIILSVFLGYYGIYDQYSELGALILGMIQSTVEHFLRIMGFYMPIDESSRFTGSNKYEFVKYGGSLHNINLSRLLHYYGGIGNPDLAYTGYYQLTLLPEQITNTEANVLDIKKWPVHYNMQRGLKYYDRSFLEKQQGKGNLRFLKFVEGTYIWDPVPELTYELNEKKYNFDINDFRQFYHAKYVYKWSGTPIIDLFWFFEEDEMEKGDRIMDAFPRYYLFEPNVLQEEPEVLANEGLNGESGTNGFYYDLLNTAYLVPFDFPIEGSKQGAPGYRPGVRPPHLFAMLNSVEPIEYSRATWRLKKGLPVLKSMHYVQMLHEFKSSLLSRKDELVRISTELHGDLYIGNEVLSENIEWQMRLYAMISYPFKWFNIRFELIRISLYKNWVYNKTIFGLYYYYYDPKIRVFFLLSFIQKIIVIYPIKGLCFCGQLGNSVYPLPQKTVNFIWGIVLGCYNYGVGLVLYVYKTLSQEQFIDYLYLLYYNFFIVGQQFIHKLFRFINSGTVINQFLLNILHGSFILVLPNINIANNLPSLIINTQFNISIYNIFDLTGGYILYNKLYIYLSLDEYYNYFSYKYKCYGWFGQHIIQGYVYLGEHSFYINEQNKYTGYTFTEFFSRERGTIDRRIIHDIVSDGKNILAYGYIRDMGDLMTRKQIHISGLRYVQVMCINKDLGISFINYGFFRLWYGGDILCQIGHSLLIYQQNYSVVEGRHSVIGGAPMLMVWMNKIQFGLDDLYIYLQLPRRLNKYGLNYTSRGYDLLHELNMMYVIRRTNFGYTRTGKSLNMLTYLVLMVKYPNNGEHFTIFNNSSVFKNSNGLRVVANKLFANLSGGSSGVYYSTIVVLLFLSNNFRHLLFCTTGEYAAHTNNREFKGQRARLQTGAKLKGMFIPPQIQPFMKKYVELKNKLELQMYYYTNLMVNNTQLPLEYPSARLWVDQLHSDTLLHKTARGYNYKRTYLSPMYVTYLLNSHYNSLHTNFAYSSNNFNKFIGYAELRDIHMKLAGENLEINRAYTEVDPAYLYHQSYINLHMKQLDKGYDYNFNLDRYLFDFNLPDWAWHRDGFNMRIFASKNPQDLTQQLTYVYEDERSNYIPWTFFGGFLAIPLCLVIKPLAGIGQWLQHSNKEDPAGAGHLSYYVNNLGHHISLFKYFYYLAGPWVPETKLLASMETDESEDYGHYHEQSAFLREFFYSYEENEPVDIYQLLYTSPDSLGDSSLEEMRAFLFISFLVLLLSLLLAIFKKNPQNKINLSKIYHNLYIQQWLNLKTFLPLKHYLHKIFPWFWQ